MVHNKHGCFPCKFACSFPLESDNSSEDELPFDENILQGGYKQDEEKGGNDQRCLGQCHRTREIRRAAINETSNNNIRLTVKKKSIFCCIPFNFLTSSSFTAYRCTDYCANTTELLSSTLARV